MFLNLFENARFIMIFRLFTLRLQLGFWYMVGVPGCLARCLTRFLARFLTRVFGQGFGDQKIQLYSTVLHGRKNRALQSYRDGENLEENHVIQITCIKNLTVCIMHIQEMCKHPNNVYTGKVGTFNRGGISGFWRLMSEKTAWETRREMSRTRP